MPPPSSPLVELGRELLRRGYRFTTITPETHRRVNAHAPRLARSLRDVFGWSRPFEPETLRGALLDGLRAAGALEETPDGFRSQVRASSLGDYLFLHSAYPTTDANAVFFGPDTYRFCRAIERASLHAKSVVDVGCGTGAGGIVAREAVQAARVVLADVNEEALTYARINAEINRVPEPEIVQSDVLASVTGDVNLVVANPPYMRDAACRTYRDGGGSLGERLAVRIAEESLARLTRGGTLLLYTGAAFVEGRDTFFDAVEPVLARANASFDYQEIDPDVFGEELDQPGYAAVERIAAVVLRATSS